MNPFRKIANSLMNWWKGETAPEVSDSTELTGGVMTLNSPSFLESIRHVPAKGQALCEC